MTRYENAETKSRAALRDQMITFCVKLNENATETYEKLKRAYGEHAVSRALVFRWHKSFLNGRESVEDEPRSGRLYTSNKAFLNGRERVEDEPRSGRPYMSQTEENVTKVRALVRSDRRLMVRIIGSKLNLNHQTVHDILTEELGMQQICEKLVP